jgi:DNA invertase Pin-like site-specific DNA recombinase
MNKFVGYIKGNSEKKVEEQKKILKLYVNDTEGGSDEHGSIFKDLIKSLCIGDTIVVTSLKIISYDARQIIEFISTVEENGLYFISIEESINTSMEKDRKFAESCMILAPYSVQSTGAYKKK